MSSHPEAEALLRKLDSIAALSEPDRAAVRALPMQVADLRADQGIVREGDRPSRCCLIVDGFAAISKLMGDGDRQITAFQIAGDIPDLLSLHLSVLDSSISTLTPCRVAFIQHEPLLELGRRCPGITDALWRATLIDGSIFREWIANIGQRPARDRMAHLFCEVLARMRAIGLGEDDSCAFPITQVELAEATGMTPVHVNRTIQHLRDEGLISLAEQRLTVHDRAGLEAIGGFEPTYLHLREPERAVH